MPCRKFIVTGQVHGVSFRASTRSEATRLGVTGHARNIADGSVEVVACGTATALTELERWLHRGPPAAKVEYVLSQPLGEQSFIDFDIG